MSSKPNAADASRLRPQRLSWRSPKFLIPAGLVVAAVLILAALYATRDPKYRGIPRRAIAFMEQGDRALQADSVEQALQYYLKAVDLDPTFSEALAKAAETYFVAGLKHKANRNMQMKENMFQSSLAFAQRALAANPDDGYAYYVLGLHDQENGKIDDALVKMELAEKYGVNTFSFHAMMAYLYNEKAETGLCLKHYLKAYAIKPDDVGTLYNLAEIYFHLGNFPNAVRYNSELVALAPRSNEYKANYASALWKNGDQETARRIFNQILQDQQSRNYDNYNAVAWTLIDRDIDLDWGIRLALAADAMKPGNIGSTDILGWAYYLKKDYAKAVTYLTRSMRKKPSEEVKQRLKMAKDKLEESKY